MLNSSKPAGLGASAALHLNADLVLDLQGHKVALQALASFAGELRQRISRETIQELNHLQSDLP